MVSRRNGIAPRTAERARQAMLSAICTLGIAILPLAALADDDDAPKPLDPQAMAFQNRAWAAAVILIVASFLWYRLRVWQIKRSGNTVDGEDHLHG